MAIRITKKDKDLIRRINQNVRAKERRLRNEYGITSDFNVKNVNKFKTRAELNNYISEARGFTRGYANRYRKNKYGFVARVVDIHKAQYETERANKERKRRRLGDGDFRREKARHIQRRGIYLFFETYRRRVFQLRKNSFLPE